MKNYALCILKSTNLRQRIDSAKISTEDPVLGLPGNWYNDEWLAKQPAHIIRRLDMQEDVELKIPDYIIEYVKCRGPSNYNLRELCRHLKAEDLYI